MNTDTRELERKLGHRFRNRTLLEAALTHRSFRFEQEHADDDNQRLEFLGDAVLGLMTAEYFYLRDAGHREGHLTRQRSQVCSGRTLAKLAREIGLDAHLRVGKGEEASEGRTRPSNLSDAMEALVGAVYLDGGWRGARRMFQRVFAPYAEQVSREEGEENPKGCLQEYCQGRWKENPVYVVAEISGPPHARTYAVEVRLPDGTHAAGRGGSKRLAESAAARSLLRGLNAHCPPSPADVDSPS